MVHADHTFPVEEIVEDEGLEYVTLGGGEEELLPPARPRPESAGTSWGLDEGY